MFHGKLLNYQRNLLVFNMMDTNESFSYLINIPFFMRIVVKVDGI